MKLLVFAFPGITVQQHDQLFYRSSVLRGVVERVDGPAGGGVARRR